MISLDPHVNPALAAHSVIWLADPEVVRYSENRHRIHTLASCEDYLRGFLTGPHRLWHIIDDVHGHIGNVTATVDEPNSVADLAILIGRKRSWGQGVGSVAWKLAMNDMLARDIRKVTGGCMANNMGMVRIMERCGMKQDGERPRHRVWEGEEIGLVYYAVYR